FVQVADGAFRRTEGPWDAHADREDVAALFFDADGDGDVDLYVGSGGNEHPAGSTLLQDRLYVNDGGTFDDATSRLPSLRTSVGVVVAGDIDGDDDPDLFVGGRLVPGEYPKPPPSAVLVNTDGRFEDATERMAPGLAEIGMVTAARFSDLDGDNDQDLAVVGEWMPVVLATNDGGVLSPEAIPRSEGWWQGLTVLESNGRPRLIAGNVGRNIKFSTSLDAPFKAYAKDFDGSGTLDIVLASTSGDEEYPVRGRECSSQQMPFIKEKFETYHAFGRASLRDIYGGDLDEALTLQSTTFDSSVWSREGDRWRRTSLPGLAQIGTGHGIVPHDLDQDGYTDLLVAGNLEKTEVETTRIDGGTGLVLLGSADGSFTPVESVRSGFTARGDVKALAKLRLGTGTGIVVVRNDGPVSLFRVLAD
ncbi:MAG: FG-GAP-like repeat-containing protein, partial [Myxococcota bacterium]